MKGLLKFGALAVFAIYLVKFLGKQDAPPEASPYPSVRDAGPEEQEGITSEDWDTVDQQSDESFPASDPPGNY
ncbi:hypothetical protein BH10PSE12_BH10PSE12_26950 [soil metagenome]